jgi:hypothetical protein
MEFQPYQHFADQEARKGLSDLKECLLAQNIRITFLEKCIQQNCRNAEEFDRAKQQITFLDTAITRLKEANVIHLREHQNIVSKVGSIEQSQKELKDQMIEQKVSLQLSSLESDVLQLRRTLIENSILP